MLQYTLTLPDDFWASTEPSETSVLASADQQILHIPCSFLNKYLQLT